MPHLLRLAAEHGITLIQCVELALHSRWSGAERTVLVVWVHQLDNVALNDDADGVWKTGQ